jgi:hypothetical protein
MKVNPRTLYRLIDAEKVWKEPGPSAKRFYFYHRDPQVHRKLREAFQRDSGKKS